MADGDVDMDACDDARVQRIEQTRVSKSIIVPTRDAEVRVFLRGLREPVTLFGEGNLERRDRLRELLTKLDQDAIERLQQVIADGDAGAQVAGSLIVNERPEGTFFTEGSDGLRQFRHKVAIFSIQRAKERLRTEKEMGDESMDGYDNIRNLTNQASELADTRPAVSCAFSPGDEYIAVASWSGNAKIWNAKTLQVETTIEAHEERLTSVVWHPGFTSTSNDASTTVHLATGSADCTAKLWNANGTLLRTLEGHSDRLARMAMHPMGEHLATASFDMTWRLWDLESGVCVLDQEDGHSKPVYGICFNGDGSLAVSAGLDGYARVWDLRTGRSVSVLKGHARGITAVDFNSNGYMIATGSLDNTVRVYDLRRLETLSVLPGHNSLVSQVRFDPSGRTLVTASYDNTVKCWCDHQGGKFQLTNTLQTGSRVMAADVRTSGSQGLVIATTEWAKTLKIWEADDPM
jgi:U4/U6 small nuclear ribonucleoprotein PRP4